MNYLASLFAPAQDPQARVQEKQQRPERQHSSASLTSTLYSVTFTPKPRRPANAKHRAHSSRPEEPEGEASKITIVAHGESQRADAPAPTARRQRGLGSARGAGAGGEEVIAPLEPASLGGCRLLTGHTLGPRAGIATSAANLNPNQNRNQDQADRVSGGLRSGDQSRLIGFGTDDDDWILLDNSEREEHRQPGQWREEAEEEEQQAIQFQRRQNHKHQLQQQSIDSKERSQQMALDLTDVELVKASWLPVRKDPVASGVLLFKG